MFYPAFQAHAYLHHIGLSSSNPNELANFYKTALNMKKVKSGSFDIKKDPSNAPNSLAIP